MRANGDGDTASIEWCPHRGVGCRRSTKGDDGVGLKFVAGDDDAVDEGVEDGAQGGQVFFGEEVMEIFGQNSFVCDY